MFLQKNSASKITTSPVVLYWNILGLLGKYHVSWYYGSLCLQDISSQSTDSTTWRFPCLPRGRISTTGVPSQFKNPLKYIVIFPKINSTWQELIQLILPSSEREGSISVVAGCHNPPSSRHQMRPTCPSGSWSHDVLPPWLFQTAWNREDRKVRSGDDSSNFNFPLTTKKKRVQYLKSSHSN